MWTRFAFVLFCLLTLIAQKALPVFAEVEPETIPFTLVADTAPGSDSSMPANLFAIGDTLFYTAYNTAHGTELWKSVPPYTSSSLVEDVFAGDGGSYPSQLAANKDTLFFQASDGKSGRELWKSLPPYNSAQLVTDLNPDGDSAPNQMTSIGTAVFFQADDCASGRELWMSQSPFNSARRVADLFPDGGSSDPSHLITMGWMLFFTANDSQGREVWKTEPPYDASSTTRVENIFPGDYTSPDQLYALDTTLFFSAVDQTDNGMELWKSVPPFTPESTSKVAKYAYLFRSPDPYNLISIGDTLFFSAAINTIGVEPWKSMWPYSLTSTTRIDDINEGLASSEPDQKTPIGSTLLFTAADGKTGYELWRAIPPYEKASQVMDIFEGAEGSWPRDLVRMGSTLYFTANDGKGRQLWQADVPFDKATKLTSFRWLGGILREPTQLLVIGNTLFFVAGDAEHGIEVRKLVSGAYLPKTGFAPNQITEVESLAPDSAYQQQAMQLSIPRLGVNAAIVGVPPTAGGWNLDWLDRDIGYLQGSAFPTRPGNTWLTAHVTGRDGLPGPFAGLNTLQWGDRVEIEAWGERYIYEVRSKSNIMADANLPDPIKDNTWLTLITCQDYDKASGEYRSRLLVNAVLIKVEPLP